MTGDMAQSPGSDLQAVLRRAMGLLATAPAEAETLARQVLATHPGDPDVSTVLSAARRAQGDAAGAERAIAAVAEQRPEAWAVQFEWARVLFALGRSREAIAPAARAAERNPGLAGAWRLLGDIRLVSGDIRAAQAAYDWVLRAVIPDPRLYGAADAMIEGRLAEAERGVRAILTADPSALPAAHLLAETLARRGELGAAEALLAHCTEQSPKFVLARLAYALVLQGAGKLLEALAQLDRFLAQNPGDVRGRAAKAAVLTEIGDYERAVQITAGLLGEFPDQPNAWILQGHGLRTLGRTREAVAAWRRAIELAPASGEAYWCLSNLKAYRFAPGERAAMEARLADPDLPNDERSLMAFALGKAAEDDGAFEPAFERYALANTLQHARRTYDAAVTTALVQRSKALFGAEFFERRAGWGEPAPDPIFIVGLPRSGSTLVEQILASHPAVESTSELMDIEAMAHWVASLAPGGDGYPDQLASAPRDVIAQLGRDYLARTAPRRRQGRSRFVDKAPWNWRHAGFIQLILPRARIIDVRRHPLGCCLSAFKQHFVQGSDFAYDLADLGRYYADYVDLMAHFDAVTPGRIHRVVYERLVEDTEGELRRLLDYLELPFAPECLKFFETRRPVATPSSEQVRLPIFTEAIDHWRHFEPWLGPLKTALGPMLDAYPAAPA